MEKINTSYQVLKKYQGETNSKHLIEKEFSNFVNLYAEAGAECSKINCSNHSRTEFVKVDLQEYPCLIWLCSNCGTHSISGIE